MPSLNKEKERNRRRISEFFSKNGGCSKSANQLPGFQRATYASIERSRLRAKSAASQHSGPTSRLYYSRSPVPPSTKTPQRQAAGKRYSVPTARASDKADRC